MLSSYFIIGVLFFYNYAVIESEDSLGKFFTIFGLFLSSISIVFLFLEILLKNKLIN